MEFRILTFQLYPKYVYDISSDLNLLLEQKITGFLKDFDHGFDLDFSIICNAHIEDNIKLGENIKHRGKRKKISQLLILPNKYLYFEPDYKFYLNRFDFKWMERGYKTYPIEKYIQFTFEGIQHFFNANSINLPDKFNNLKNEILDFVNLNKYDFLYESEEKMHLRKMINKDHWAYHEEHGKEWLTSDVGLKWLRLASKYKIKEDGMLELKD